MRELGFKSYNLSPVGDMIAGHASIANALDCVQGSENRSSGYARTTLDLNRIKGGAIEDRAIEIWRELDESELGSAYTETDRNNALRYVRTLTQPDAAAVWTVDGKYSIDGRLIAQADKERLVAAQPSDIGILTGYGALDLIKCGLGTSTVDKYGSQGFRSVLHYAQFLSACAAERLGRSKNPEREARYTERTGHNFGRLVVVTADMQGDLNITASENYPYGARDVLGEQQKFAPARANEVTLTAYDKAEPGLLKTIMRWANLIKVPEKVQLRYFTCAVYEALSVKEKADPFSAESYYSKFLSRHAHGLDRQADAATKEQAISQHQRDIGYVAVGAETVFGTDAMLKSYVRLDDNALLMRTDRGYEPYEGESMPQIVFPPAEMYRLIKALVEVTMRGVSRTSFQTMAGMIAYRFDPEFREYVRSPEFHERNNRTGELLARFYASK